MDRGALDTTERLSTHAHLAHKFTIQHCGDVMLRLELPLLLLGGTCCLYEQQTAKQTVNTILAFSLSSVKVKILFTFLSVTDVLMGAGVGLW